MIIGKTNVPRADAVAVHRDGHVRGHAQPVGPPARTRRIQRRQRGGGGGGARRRRARLRRGRLDPHPGGVVRAVRAQAPARTRLDGAARARVARPVCQRRADAGGRHGAVPRRCLRARSTATRTARRRPLSRSRRRRDAARSACGSPYSTKRPARRDREARRDDAAARVRGDGRAAALARARARRARPRLRPRRDAGCARSLSARRARRRRASSRIPSGWNAARAGWRGWAG